MPAPRKYLPHNGVIMFTFGLEQGLMLLANDLCRIIVESCLARAQKLYPIDISHFIFHSNHVHLVGRVINPEDSCKFIGYLKAEIAHRLNIITGWKKRTIWCAGYDSPLILTPVRALMAISYIYANPAKDCQVNSIDEYPGLSTWQMFQTGIVNKNCKYIDRPKFRQLGPKEQNRSGYQREARRLLSLSKEYNELEIKPNAWLEAYGINDPSEQKKWNDLLIERTRTLEKRAREKRELEGKKVIGSLKLRERSITANYKPKRKGFRTWCLSEKRAHKTAFIRFIKNLIKDSKEVYRRWHLGDYSIPYPSGLFPPNQPRLVNALAYA